MKSISHSLMRIAKWLGIALLLLIALFFYSFSKIIEDESDRTVTNVEYGFSITVPTDWQLGEPREGVPFVAKTSSGRVFEIGRATYEELSSLAENSDEMKEFWRQLAEEMPGANMNGETRQIAGSSYVVMYIPAVKSKAALSYGRLDKQHPVLLTLSGELGMTEAQARPELEMIIATITWLAPLR